MERFREPDCPGGELCAARRGWSPACRRCKRAAPFGFPSVACPNWARPPYDLR